MANPRYLRKEDDVARFVDSVPALTPREMFDQLEALGYKSQEEARRAVCLHAYRHLRRIKQIHVGRVERPLLPPKTNVLMMGPTGCGKTFMVELLFREVLRLPTIIIDITGFTETGYVGRDVITILTSLIKAAGDDPGRASVGVVCVDEFDKLASSQNVARFEGQGTTKDVAGYGVQKELLKLLSSSVVEVPLEYNNTYYSSHVRMLTDDVMFIACGAFSGFKGLVSADRPRIGYSPGAAGAAIDDVAYELEAGEIGDIANFQNYGFLPELIARFSRVVALGPLRRETLRSILVDNTLPRYVAEFRSEGLVLKMEDAVVDRIVERATERRVGARGLEMELGRVLEQAAFENFGRGAGEVRVQVRDGKIEVVSEIATTQDPEPSGAEGPPA
jgi:ATP-dependent Clp protease ATP-binding subunit ClpX